MMSLVTQLTFLLLGILLMFTGYLAYEIITYDK